MRDPDRVVCTLADVNHLAAPHGILSVRRAFDHFPSVRVAAKRAQRLPRLLLRFDDPSRPSLRREFAADGMRFFFTIAQDESDVWIAEVR